MNRFRLYIILSLLIIFATSSCTVTKDVVNNSFIQKRKYNKGFFVKNTKSKETAKHYNKDVVINDSSNEGIEEKQTITEPKIEKKTASEQELLVSKESEIITKPKLKSSIEIPSYFNGVNFIKARKKLRKIDIEPDDEKELIYSQFAVIGLFLSIIALLFGAVSMYLYYAISYYSAFLYLAVGVVNIISYGLVIPVIAFCLVGIIQAILYRDKYKGFWLSVIGLIIILSLILLMLFL